MENIDKIVFEAAKAKIKLMDLETEIKNRALLAVADALEMNKNTIFEANKKDLDKAQALVSGGEISNATYGRLKLDKNKMRDMIQGIRDVANLPDPVGKILLKRELDEGLTLTKITCPIGVIGVIFEARPDVIAQISSLAIKSGNAVILKGGKESDNTNTIIHSLIIEALDKIKEYPKNAIGLLHSRDEVKKMLEMDKYIDLIIPRGSNELVKHIQKNTRIPVLGHASGVCNIYIDKYADRQKAIEICVDAKCQYPSACNTVENILIHKDFKHINDLKNVLIQNGVEVIENKNNFSTEFGEKIVNIVTVEDISDATTIINLFGSHHTDCIITENEDEATTFFTIIDSAGVYWNCSTRFADGFRYGFGAEVGISTNKTHARGPVGLEGLTIYKYLLKGNGHIVTDYAEGRKIFHHKDLPIDNNTDSNITASE